MNTDPTPPSNVSESITENPAATPTAPVASAPSPWPTRIDYVLLALLLILSFLLGSFTAGNSDLWLHLAVGKQISEGTFTFGVDSFSWATESVDGSLPVYWVHHSWLFSWLLYQLYTLFGGTALVVGKALLIVATIALLTRIGWDGPGRWFVLSCATLAVLAMSARFTLQPMVVSFLFLALTLYLLDRAGVFVLGPSPPAPLPEGEGGKAGILWALPPLFALWANLDVWFILGPMVVGLCWAAVGLSRWFRGAGRVPGKTLGLIFGIGALACVVNPFHVRVFQLPPELAYLVLTVTDPLGLSLPDAIIAGGRTLKELRRANVETGWTISPISIAYMKDDRLGFNIAAFALMPLLLLGLGGFSLMAMVKQQPGAPSLHVGRFLLWLVFGIMALALFRLIPLFALIAAPMTALTLGEFLHWQQTAAGTPLEQRDRGLRLARFLSIPFLLLLIVLAWPGLLHGSVDAYHPHHVAWEVRAEPSLERGARTLMELHEKNEAHRVFNVGFEMGHYLAWHAPEVKYGLDTRFALYSAVASEYAKARQALVFKNSRAPLDENWMSLFVQRDLDHVILSSFFVTGREESAVAWWADELRWRQRYGDGRTMVFSWAGRGKTWPVMTAWNDVHRLAFGAVTEDCRPPREGTLPKMARDTWAVFLEPIGPTPVEVSEVKMLKNQHELVAQSMHPPRYQPAGKPKPEAVPWDLLLLEAGMPGNLDTRGLGLAFHLQLMRPRDYSAPALPILMMRAARRAVAANPLDPKCHLALRDAVLASLLQEGYATREFGTSQVRDGMRQMQMKTCLVQAAQLRAEEYFWHKELYETYLKSNLIDAGLEEMRIAKNALDQLKASGKIEPRQIDGEIKYHREVMAEVEQKVKERLAKWRELSEGRPPLEKAALAFGGRYVELFREKEFVTNLGLARTALDTLNAIPVDALKAMKPEQLLYYHALRFDILLELGHADVVAANLREGMSEGLKKAHPLALARYQFLAGAAVGDYVSCDLGMAALQELAQGHLQMRLGQEAASIVMEPILSAQGYPAPFFVTSAAFRKNMLAQERGELCNLITLRGILALEAGNTKQARDFFQEALTTAGDMHFFPDRPLAKRYLDLIDPHFR